jgi:hypothetical protein
MFNHSKGFAGACRRLVMESAIALSLPPGGQFLFLRPSGPSFQWLDIPGSSMAPRYASGSSPDESMAAEPEAPLGQPGLPAFFGPDCRPVVEQTVFLLLLGQPCELGVEGMIDR